MQTNLSKETASNRRLELKKHVNAIHCTNNLTLVQRKLFNALLFNAYPNLPHKTQYQIQARQLCRLIGYNSNDYAKLKKALLGLITIAIEWNVIDCNTGKEKQWKASAILASAELEHGTCTYEYSQVMKQFLYQPEIYGRVDLKLMSQFKSSYGLALYENCIRYQGLAQTPWFPLEIFRKLMGVFGTKYSVFKDFKKRVLSVAVEEVNRLSHISITPEIERRNQKVVKIRFKLKKTKQSQKNTSVEPKNIKKINELMSSVFNLSEHSIKELLAQYKPTYIQEKIDIIMASDSFIEGKIRGLAGYLIESLRKDYQISKTSRVVVHQQKKQKELEQHATKTAQKQLETKYEKYTRDQFNKYLSSLSPDEHKMLIRQFEAHIKSSHSLIYKWYLKDGLDHIGAKACFNEFIKKQCPKVSKMILSLQEFTDLLA